MQKEELPNIAMADAFMAIFGYKRIKPTDEELERKYNKGLASVDNITFKALIEFLEKLTSETNDKLYESTNIYDMYKYQGMISAYQEIAEILRATKHIE